MNHTLTCKFIQQCTYFIIPCFLAENFQKGRGSEAKIKLQVNSYTYSFFNSWDWKIFNFLLVPFYDKNSNVFSVTAFPCSQWHSSSSHNDWIPLLWYPLILTHNSWKSLPFFDGSAHMCFIMPRSRSRFGYKTMNFLFLSSILVYR